MIKVKSIFMWDNVEKTIQTFYLQTDLIYKTINFYDPQYCSKNNENGSLKYSHIIGEFVPIKKPHDFIYRLKSQCTYIIERFS